MNKTSYKQADESVVLAAAQTGDKAAFNELLRRYEDTVYRFSYKVCRDKDQAAETLQDTFINVFRKLGTFDGKSKFSTWLYTIVTNNCLMKHRHRKSDELVDSLEEYDAPPEHEHSGKRPPLPHSGETPADVVLTRELRGVLDRAMKRLPEDYRVVFVLRDTEGRSNEETARILGITVEATKSRLRRARAFLRDQLDPYLSTDSGRQS